MISVFRNDSVGVRFYDDEVAILSRREGTRKLVQGPIVTVMRRMVESSGLDGLQNVLASDAVTDPQQKAVIQALRDVFDKFAQQKGSTQLGAFFKVGSRLPALSLTHRFPLTAMCEVTYRCNLRCKHCFVLHKIEEDKPAHVDDEVILRMLGELVTLGCLDVTLTGGEVTLHRGWQNFVTRAKDVHLYTVLKTNATTFTAQRAEAYAQDPGNETHASLYGSKPETHDAFTAVPGSLEKTLMGLRNLSKVGIRVKVNTTIWHGNTEELAEMKQMMEDMGHQIEFDDIIHGRLNGDRSPRELKISAETRSKLVEQGWLEPFEPKPCGAGKIKIKIDAEGKVATCELFAGGFGNAHETSVAELWNAPTFKNSSEETIRLANAEKEGTKVIPACPGLNLLNTGKMEGRTEV